MNTHPLHVPIWLFNFACTSLPVEKNNKYRVSHLSWIAERFCSTGSQKEREREEKLESQCYRSIKWLLSAVITAIDITSRQTFPPATRRSRLLSIHLTVHRHRWSVSSLKEQLKSVWEWWSWQKSDNFHQGNVCMDSLHVVPFWLVLFFILVMPARRCKTAPAGCHRKPVTAVCWVYNNLKQVEYIFFFHLHELWIKAFDDFLLRGFTPENVKLTHTVVHIQPTLISSKPDQWIPPVYRYEEV